MRGWLLRRSLRATARSTGGIVGATVPGTYVAHGQDDAERPHPPEDQRRGGHGEHGGAEARQVRDGEQPERHEQRADDECGVFGAVQQRVLPASGDLVAERLLVLGDELDDELRKPVEQAAGDELER